MKDKLTSCESCNNYEYDEQAGGYICLIEMDEDEIYRLGDRGGRGCPFYHVNDEYSIVRKQN